MGEVVLAGPRGSMLATRGRLERLSEEELWRQRGGQMSDPPVSQANRLDGREYETIRRMGRAGDVSVPR